MRDNASSADNQQETPSVLEQMAGSSETKRRISQMNRELATLLGILFTDGCVSRKGNSWRIYFVNKSWSLVELFRDSMIAVFGLNEHRVRIGRTKDNLWSAIVNSQEIGNYLVTMFGTFRTLKFDDGTLPTARLPIKQLLASACETDFLRAAFSCDGGVGFYPAYRSGSQGGTKWLIRTIFLACAHPVLRTGYMSLLDELGIQAREVTQDEKIKIETEVNIKKFRDIIGFVSGTQVTNVSKFWRGYEKQSVLELMADSYSDPSKVYNLQKFQTLR